MDSNDLSRPERAGHLTGKGKAAVFAVSLAFILLALSMVAGVFEGPMFVDRASARIDQLQARYDAGDAAGIQSELNAVRDEVRREKSLMNRYMIFAVLAALANAFLGIWLVGRSRMRKRHVLWLALSGLFWGLSLSAIYRAMHSLILPGGLQDTSFREWLSACLLAFSVLNGLIVAWISLRLSRPKKGLVTVAEGGRA
jgi:hypothetical protein